VSTANHADWERAAEMYPVTQYTGDKAFWTFFFEQRPDVLHQLLGDLYLITKVHEKAERRGGRRARMVNGNLDELWGMLTPRYANVGFGDAVRELMGDASLRQFAARIPMHHHSLARLMNGERQVVNPHDAEGSMRLLESVARAGGVHPAYFAEWRELYVLHALHEVFTAHPNLSIGVVKKLRRQVEDTQPGRERALA
jgi:hypothetical protein